MLPIGPAKSEFTTATPSGPFVGFVNRFPVLSIFLLLLLSNVAGSVFNVLYNTHLIVFRYLDPQQKDIFHYVVLPLYNAVAYPICLGIAIYVLLPISWAEKLRRAGKPVPEPLLAQCQHLLVNAPSYAIWLSILGWMPGAIFFPWLITWLGGTHNALQLWLHFPISFTVSAALTTVQTFFLLENFCIRFLYPHYFQDIRPAQVEGANRLHFALRLLFLWSAVGLMPLVALLMVAVNFTEDRGDVQALRWMAVGVFVVGSLTGGLIARVVGRGLLRWLKEHAAATEEVAHGNFAVRIGEKRPDEWGRLSDRFNDMTEQLAQAEKMRETFGQIVHPAVRDAVMQRFPGLGGEVQDITVVFADIRDFTTHSAGESPERVVALLNQFLTLAVAAVEEKGGMVNKFLGDGLMALFGALESRSDHADQAVRAALDLLERLELLNRRLMEQGEKPLKVGVGIHSGPALVGCVGATMPGPDGEARFRRELTAIGETVNLAQRMEQLTKTCGGPILISEPTRLRLRQKYRLASLGEQPVSGYGLLMVHHVVKDDSPGEQKGLREAPEIEQSLTRVSGLDSRSEGRLPQETD